MKFNDASKEAQLVLMTCAFAGVIESLTENKSSDEAQKILVAALQRVGLTEDEFGRILNDVEGTIADEVAIITQTAEIEQMDRYDAEAQADVANIDDDETDEDGWQNLHEDRVCLVCKHEYCKCE